MTKKLMKASAFERFYQFALNIYFAIRPLRLKELIVGTKAWEDYWAKRTKGKDWNYRNDGLFAGYWTSIKHPHRQLLVESMAKYRPDSILEVGCSCAPNLYLLAKRFQEAEIWGVDINRQAVEYGQIMFGQGGIENVWLATRKADELLFADKTFDVVLTDATLIYIGRDKIIPVIERILNIAKKGLVLVERHIEGVGALGVYRDGLWQRDYMELLGFYIPKKQITITPIPESIWPEWAETGCIIEVKL